MARAKGWASDADLAAGIQRERQQQARPSSEPKEASGSQAGVTACMTRHAEPCPRGGCKPGLVATKWLHCHRTLAPPNAPCSRDRFSEHFW